MRAYAAATSTTASYEKIRDAATGGENEKPAKATIQGYRSVLEQIWIIEPLPAWMPTRRRLTRLTAPPKHHCVDPALAARLMGVTTQTLLTGVGVKDQSIEIRDGTLLGALFESLVTLCVRVYAQNAEAHVSHMRTKGGDREIDLVVERSDGKIIAIEVKLGQTAKDSDVVHLNWLDRQLGPELLDKIVITTGREAYRRKDGVGVIPAALLGP